MRIVALLKIFMNGAIQVAIQVAILRVISKDDPGAILRAIQRALLRPLKGNPEGVPRGNPVRALQSNPGGDDSLHCHSMGNNTPKTSMTTGEYYGDRIGNSGGDPGGYSWVCLQGQCWGGS